MYPRLFTSKQCVFSAKFGRKIQYVNHLSELSQHMNINTLPIPKQVKTI